MMTASMPTWVLLLVVCCAIACILKGILKLFGTVVWGRRRWLLLVFPLLGAVFATLVLSGNMRLGRVATIWQWVISTDAPRVSVSKAPAVAHRGEPERHPAEIHANRRPFVVNGIWRGDLLWSLLTAFTIAALLYLGYIFLDASTRGHFTWRLRILSVLTFAVLCAVVVALRNGL